jgi:hypothetical protein
VTLFHADPERLRLPKSARRESAKYTTHSGKGRDHRCDDCLEIIHEWHQAGGTGPPPPVARTAKYNRKVGTQPVRLICPEHKHLRDELERTR